MNKTKKTLLTWIITTVLTFLFIYAVVCGFRIWEEFDLAKYNEYMAEHIRENIAWIMENSVDYAFYPTISVGQIMFVIMALIQNLRNDKKGKDSNLFTIIATPIATLISSIILAIVTLPLWFHIQF